MKNLFLILVLLAPVFVSAQQVPKGLTASNGVFIGFYEYKPTDYAVQTNTSYPLIIFLHGIGERGNGTTDLPSVLANAIPRYINSGHPMRFFWNGKWETFLVLSPQLSTSYGDWQNFYVDAMLQYAKQNLRIDTNRIILTGLSLGGGGTWRYASSSLANAKKFAAIAPVCGTCSMVNACSIAQAALPVSAFHAQNDGTVGVGCTTNAIQSINNCSPAVKPLQTIYADGGHAIWDRAYDTVYNWQQPNIYEWMLGQNKSLPVNTLPRADAGNAVTISTNPGSTVLNGSRSTDADGNIVRYVWRKISGPDNVQIQSPVSADGKTNVTGLTSTGIYGFELKVVDNRAAIALDTVLVTVAANAILPNNPPVAIAGAAQTSNTGSTTLIGSNSYDPDGIITNYNWEKISGPAQFQLSSTSAADPIVQNLTSGTYQFVLTATDNLGAIDRDTVTINTTISVVPLQFVQVLAKPVTVGQEICWKTANESNTISFAVEYSSDGRLFQKIGSLPSAPEFNKKGDYCFTHIANKSGTGFYRIMQIDNDGKSSYSVIIPAQQSASKEQLKLWPQPAQDELNIIWENNYTGPVTISLINVEGRLQSQYSFIKNNPRFTKTLSLKSLRSGMYFLRIQSVQISPTTKMIIKQ